MAVEPGINSVYLGLRPVLGVWPEGLPEGETGRFLVGRLGSWARGWTLSLGEHLKLWLCWLNVSYSCILFLALGTCTLYYCAAKRCPSLQRHWSCLCGRRMSQLAGLDWQVDLSENLGTSCRVRRCWRTRHPASRVLACRCLLVPWFPGFPRSLPSCTLCTVQLPCWL